MTDDRGLSFGNKPRETTTTEFANNHAYLIGINAYQNGIPQLRTAVADAERLGKLLKESHGYTVLTLPRNGAPTLTTLRDLLHKKMLQEVGPNDRVLVYFAGHGIALDGEDGPEGYLVPADANREDRNSFLSMTELNDALAKLPCRHLLLILDCCFAGAFRWSSTRDLSGLPSVIHRERYERYIQDPAWQVLTSAAYDQTALDVLSGNTIGERIETSDHSPFAAALFRALAGDADLIPRGKDGLPAGDGVITATELYLYLRECVETATVEQRTRQTPGLWPLKKHDKGEYILLSPGHELNLPPAPELNYANNPYRGLQSFEEEHSQLFFGRKREIEELRTLVSTQPLTVVLGASGTGKSSVVKAGLLPHLRCVVGEDWQILPVIRPGKSSLATLASLKLPGEATATDEASRLAQLWSDGNAFAQRIQKWAENQPSASRILLTVDQFEELITLCWDKQERDCFIAQLASAVNAMPERFRLIITLRSDFEPQFSDGALKSRWMPTRYVVPAMSTDDLRDAIEGPASVRVLYFQPAMLVDRLIDEVIQTPGAMPLLSFTLSELYVRYVERRGDDRCLTLVDLEQLGGVAGSLRSRATELYNKLNGPHQATMQRIMLRMISAQGGELARCRVPRSELVYPSDVENERVSNILTRLSNTRLVVEGKEADGDPYVEPAHDALVRGWDKLLVWTRSEQEQLSLRRLLTPAANDWHGHQGGTWHANPRLSLLNRISRGEDSWLNQTETQFIKRSATKRFMNRIAQSSFVVVAFVALGLVTAYALAEARTSYSQQLSAQSEAELDRRPDLAILLATEACQVQPTVQARSGLLRSLLRRPHIHSIMQGHDGSVGALAFNAEGSLLATAGSGRSDLTARRSVDANIRLWEVKTGLELDVIPTGTVDAIRWLFFSSRGNTITTVNSGGALIWDTVSKKSIAEMSPPGFPVSSAAASPDGKYLALGTGTDETMSVLHQGTIALWDCSELKTLWTKIGHSSRITSMAFCRRGKSLYSANGLPPKELRFPDPSIVKWDVDSGEMTAEFDSESLTSSVTALAISPDDKTLVSGCRDGTVLLWDIQSESIYTGPRIRPRHQGAVIHASFFEAEGIIKNTKAYSVMTIGADGTVIFWANDGNATEILEHYLEFEAAAFSPDATLFATSYCVEMDANDRCVKGQVGLWSRTNRPVMAEVVTLNDGDLSPVRSPSKFVHTFSHDCTRLATVCDMDSGAKCIAIRDVSTGAMVGRSVNVDTKSIEDVAFSQNDKLIAFGTSEGTVECYSVENSEMKYRLDKMQASVSVIRFGPHDDVIAVGSTNGDVALYDVVKQSRISVLPRRHRGHVESLSFSPNQKILISGGGGEIGRIPATGSGPSERYTNGEICVWDLQGRELLFPVIMAHSDSVVSLDVSPGGDVFASGGGERDRSIQVWRVDTGKQVSEPLLGHSTAVTQLVFSMDEKLLISASDDFYKAGSDGSEPDPKDHMSVILWDIENAEMVGKPLVGFRKSIRDGESPYPVGFEGVCDLKVHPDGKTIAAACRSGRHLFWQISLESWIDHGQRIVQRTLTSDERRRFLRNGE